VAGRAALWSRKLAALGLAAAAWVETRRGSTEKALSEPSKSTAREVAGRCYQERIPWKWSRGWADTQMRPRAGARGPDVGFATGYELSRGLHREANCRGVRLGPMRITPLQ
jgi:hypothetical protein